SVAAARGALAVWRVPRSGWDTGPATPWTLPAQLMTATTTGRLKIGDQWNAINIIAQSQTHPLKAVCELTENAIDAGGRRIEIVRRKLKGQIFLEVHDDGEGVRSNGDGRPDFAHIATHICDSMKRH